MEQGPRYMGKGGIIYSYTVIGSLIVSTGKLLRDVVYLIMKYLLLCESHVLYLPRI